MSSRLLVIIATAEKDKALAGLMFARNAIEEAWMGDVKIVFFGPSERLVVTDKQLSNEAREIASLGEVFACKAISDREGFSDDIETLGVKVEFVGSRISELLKQGYVPMVW